MLWFAHAIMWFSQNQCAVAWEVLYPATLCWRHTLSCDYSQLQKLRCAPGLGMNLRRHYFLKDLYIQNVCDLLTAKSCGFDSLRCSKIHDFM